jgi:hypothetical protein
MQGLLRKTYDRERSTPRYAKIKTQWNMHQKKKRRYGNSRTKEIRRKKRKVQKGDDRKILYPARRLRANDMHLFLQSAMMCAPPVFLKASASDAENAIKCPLSPRRNASLLVTKWKRMSVGYPSA